METDATRHGDQTWIGNALARIIHCGKGIIRASRAPVQFFDCCGDTYRYNSQSRSDKMAKPSDEEKAQERKKVISGLLLGLVVFIYFVTYLVMHIPSK